VLNPINNKVIPEEWNGAMIALSLKVESLKQIYRFRPISLCVLCKVTSKMIASHLEVILDDIISQAQSVFVPRHMITNNIHLAYENMHIIENKKKGKEGYCAIKLDMHKAYDHVEWNFLKRMLTRLGFQIELICGPLDGLCSQLNIRSIIIIKKT
jgi:hypothetical protein